MLSKKQIAGMGLVYRYYSFDYMLRDLQKIGFESFELYGAYPHQFINSGHSYPDISYIKKQLKNYGFKLVCYTPDQIKYPYNLASSDKEIRNFSIQYFKDTIDATVELGTDRMLITSGWCLYDENIDEAWKISIDSIGVLSDYAQKKGIILLLENLNPMESNLVYNLKGIKKIRDAVKSSALKAMVDTVPMHLANETMKDYLDEFGDDLMHVHVIDGDPIGHLAWGKGNLPLDEDIQTLVDYGYKHALTFEIENGDVEKPGDEMKVSWERVQKYLSE